MNIIELLKNAKPGDMVLVKSTGLWFEFTEDEEWTNEDILSDEWEIKKKEDEPITADEYYNQRFEQDQERRNIGDRIRDAFKAGEKNNDLKYKEQQEKLEFMVSGQGHNHEVRIARELLKLIK